MPVCFYAVFYVLHAPADGNDNSLAAALCNEGVLRCVEAGEQGLFSHNGTTESL